MGRYLMIQAVYFGVIASRHFGVVVMLCFSARPQRVRDLSNILFIIADIAAVPLMSVYGTKALFMEQGVYCRDNGNPNTFNWWVISCCLLCYGWIYSFLLCIGLTSLPLIIVFWCFYKMQMSEIQNESRLQNMPFASEIMRSLKR